MHGKKVDIKERLSEDVPESILPAYHFKSEGSAWLYGVNFNYTF